MVGAGSGRIVLVGGGDPLLTVKPSTSVNKPASLTALAQATAATLTASGVTQVSLAYDASLFTGAAYSPRWKAIWSSYTARVSALVVGSGMANKWQASTKPALTAAKAFAAQLKAAGIKVKLTGAAKAPADASELASVQSAPLSTIVGRTLRVSDNRRRRCSPGTCDRVRPARDVDKRLGHPEVARRPWAVGRRHAASTAAGCRDARVTPTVLARATLAEHRTALLDHLGLPVAGKNGTLRTASTTSPEKVARGNVRAKTDARARRSTGRLPDHCGRGQACLRADGDQHRRADHGLQLARPVSGCHGALRLHLV